MTLRESVFLILFETRIKEVIKDGLSPDFEEATAYARQRTLLVINKLEDFGWVT